MKLVVHIVAAIVALVLTAGVTQEACAQTRREKATTNVHKTKETSQEGQAVREGGMQMEITRNAKYNIGTDGKVATRNRTTAKTSKTTGNANPLGQVMEYIVEDGDTIFVDEIRASKVYSRLPKQKGKEWRKYYRLVHNFSKSYPYALVAKKMVVEADSTIAADKLKGVKREKYVSQVQKELFEVFEGQMRKLTVSQGALLMKLIDREVGKSSYSIIKDYKSGIAAGFWQGIAKMFGTDLKKPYDPEGEDKLTEELVGIWEAGDFEAFYFSIFWKDPPVMPIPEKYL